LGGNKAKKLFVLAKKILTLQSLKEIVIQNILRGGAVVARWAHNPKVTGSSPVPATRKGNQKWLPFFISH
jgi:hypothetical protein